MTDGINFRTLSEEAVRRHLDALIAVALDVPGEYWAAENFLADRPEKWRLSFGVWQSEALVGYAVLSRRAPRHIHLHHFMIAAASRGAGLGKKMVAEMLTRCGDADAEILTLKTPQDNDGAVRFYRRHGFAESGVERGHIIMTKTL